MKALIIILVILLLVSITSIRFHIYKENNKEINLYLVLTKSLKIKIDLTKLINKKISSYLISVSNEQKVYDIKKSIETFRTNKEFVKDFTHIFNGNIVYFSVNSFYYLESIELYLAVYYLYSYIQNLLYINLYKVKSTCFKTRIKNISIRTEINIDIETYIYKIIYFMIKRRKEISTIKEKLNEQSSNNRIIKNINVKH